MLDSHPPVADNAAMNHHGSVEVDQLERAALERLATGQRRVKPDRD
jgi:hypothetical protein